MSLIGVITAAGLQLASISLILSLFFYFKEIPNWNMVTLVDWKSKGGGFLKNQADHCWSEAPDG